MSKLPKKTGPNWAFLAAIVGGYIFLFFAFGVIFGSVRGGSYLGGWSFNCVLALIGFAITKSLVARNVRAKVKYEIGDADVFTDEWADLVWILILGTVISIGFAFETSPLKYIVAAALFVPFYYLYKWFYEEAELILYKNSRTKKGKK